MSQSSSTHHRPEDPTQSGNDPGAGAASAPAHTFSRPAPGTTGQAILADKKARLGLTRTIRRTLGEGGLWGPGSQDARFPRRYGGTCNFMGN